MREMRDIFSKGKAEFALVAATMLAVVILPLEEGLNMEQWGASIGTGEIQTLADQASFHEVFIILGVDPFIGYRKRREQVVDAAGAF